MKHAAPSHGTTHRYRCPKCHAPMVTRYRAGVTIERCSDCRGVFLDHGELERLMDMPGIGEPGPPVRGPVGRRGRDSDGGWNEPDGDDDDDGQHGRRGPRGGFLGDLFDVFDD